MTGPVISYVVDPRFAGGTSTAVASELRAVAGLGRIRVHCIESAMFKGRQIAPQLADALDDLHLASDWDSTTICGDLVILHNPAFLKFQTAFPRRILARRLIVVTHENLVRGGGVEAFDVQTCLDLIDGITLSFDKAVAPVSASNRRSIEAWARDHGLPRGWGILAETWHNICDMPMTAPTLRPRDRRGRLSRPGFEKFPDLAALDLCFSPQAETNVILGADALIARDLDRPNWVLHPFRGIDTETFFGQIDFMVYFTSPAWQESFGLAIAEAIAAGKVVITDEGTASTFGDGVVAATPADVDAIVAGFVADPKRYRQQVRRGQARLAEFSAAACRDRLARLLGPHRAAA